MSACVIGHITVKDADKWAQYRAQVPATLAPWGAELLFRGQLAGVIAHAGAVGSYRGKPRDPSRRATEFPGGWQQSAAYQALIPLRQQAADLELLSFTD